MSANDDALADFYAEIADVEKKVQAKVRVRTFSRQTC